MACRCEVCFEDCDKVDVCACEHSFCAQCLAKYLDSQAQSCVLGSCKRMRCPGCSALLPFRTWKPYALPRTVDRFQHLAASLLTLQCSRCHMRKSLLVPHRLRKVHPGLEEAIDLLDRYSRHDIELDDAFDLIYSLVHVATTPTASPSDEATEEAVVTLDSSQLFLWLIAAVDDPERRAMMQLKYLRMHPKVETSCCRRTHCFRCKVQGFHKGVTCEQFCERMSTQSVHQMLVFCPSCGVPLTKGDGCNYVTCVCGHTFEWRETYAKQENARSFVEKYGDNPSKHYARLLCEGRPNGDDQLAMEAWADLHRTEANDALMDWWRARYPYCPTHAAHHHLVREPKWNRRQSFGALDGPGIMTQGMVRAAQLWLRADATTRRAIDAMEKRSNNAALELLCPTLEERVLFVVRQSLNPLCAWLGEYGTYDRMALQEALQADWSRLYASRAFAATEDAFHLRLANQFICLFGHRTFGLRDCNRRRMPYMSSEHVVQLLSLRKLLDALLAGKVPPGTHLAAAATSASVDGVVGAKNARLFSNCAETAPVSPLAAEFEERHGGKTAAISYLSKQMHLLRSAVLGYRPIDHVAERYDGDTMTWNEALCACAWYGVHLARNVTNCSSLSLGCRCSPPHYLHCPRAAAAPPSVTAPSARSKLVPAA